MRSALSLDGGGFCIGEEERVKQGVGGFLYFFCFPVRSFFPLTAAQYTSGPLFEQTEASQQAIDVSHSIGQESPFFADAPGSLIPFFSLLTSLAVKRRWLGLGREGGFCCIATRMMCTYF